MRLRQLELRRYVQVFALLQFPTFSRYRSRVLLLTYAGRKFIPNAKRFPSLTEHALPVNFRFSFHNERTFPRSTTLFFLCPHVGVDISAAR